MSHRPWQRWLVPTVALGTIVVPLLGADCDWRRPPWYGMDGCEDCDDCYDEFFGLDDDDGGWTPPDRSDTGGGSETGSPQGGTEQGEEEEGGRPATGGVRTGVPDAVTRPHVVPDHNVQRHTPTETRPSTTPR